MSLDDEVKKYTLLVLDDEPTVRRAIIRHFGKMNLGSYEIVQADRPSKVNLSSLQYPLGVVICDEQMGEGERGSNFLADVKQRFPLVGLVHMSGTDEKCDAADYFFPKPFEIENLRVVVESAYKQHISRKRK